MTRRVQQYVHSEVGRKSAGPGSCSWCGQKKKTLYRYGNDRKAFCTKSCRSSYHG